MGKQRKARSKTVEYSEWCGVGRYTVSMGQHKRVKDTFYWNTLISLTNLISLQHSAK